MKDATRGDDPGLAPTASIDAADTTQTIIGRYHLVRRLGEGGMGEVWLAEQREPVRRRVALKLIKGGLNTRETIARFNSERQALALMDHPAIAKVFDADATPTGAPYFVMEYVAGKPITDYCDSHRLSTRERLELFAQVCDGVQHAHQKAIIHRDLKPSNILVTEVDGRAAPKIIDFGVAKALTQGLSTETMFTRTGGLVGTPGYMSPEQASSSGEDIDTRTDVYSLGVVFYELLAGTPPLDLRKLPLEEFLRKLRQDDPEKPSTKISAHDRATSTEVANNRQTEPLALARQLRGELDAIALKALEKERWRRYASASEFAADVRRYLNHEAVLAVPPSLAYRARKLARRHRVALATACAFAVVLVAAAVISIRQSIRANREAAVAEAVNDFLQNDLLGQASAYNQSKRDPDIKVRTVLDRAAGHIQGKFSGQPEVESAIRHTIAQTYMEIGIYPEAEKQFEVALELRRRVLGSENPATLNTMNNLATVYWYQSKFAQAEALDSQTLAIRRRVLGPEDPKTLDSMNNLALVYHDEGKYPQAEALNSQTLEIRRRRSGPEDPATLDLMNNLARDYQSEGKYAQAEALNSRTLEIRRRLLGPEHPQTLGSMNNLADAYMQEGKYAQAEALLSEAIEIRTRTQGPDHPLTLVAMHNLGVAYADDGKYAQAEEMFGRTLESMRRVLGPEHAYTLADLSERTSMYQRQGKYALAETYGAQAVAGRRHTLGAEDPDTLASEADLALACLSQKKFAEAEPLAREALESNKKVQPDDWERYNAESLLGASLAGEKKYAEAEPQLVEGYQGMLAHKDHIDAADQYRLALARGWIVDLYQAWGKPEKAAEWTKK